MKHYGLGLMMLFLNLQMQSSEKLLSSNSQDKESRFSQECLQVLAQEFQTKHGKDIRYVMSLAGRKNGQLRDIVGKVRSEIDGGAIIRVNIHGNNIDYEWFLQVSLSKIKQLLDIRKNCLSDTNNDSITLILEEYKD